MEFKYYVRSLFDQTSLRREMCTHGVVLRSCALCKSNPVQVSAGHQHPLVGCVIVILEPFENCLLFTLVRPHQYFFRARRLSGKLKLSVPDPTSVPIHENKIARSIPVILYLP